MTRRSLVTGGHGFVGSHLARALVERGDRVTVVDSARPSPGRSGLELQGIAGEVELVTVDLADRSEAAALFSANNGFDSVFHLAAQTLVGPAMRDPVATFKANVGGTWNLLEAGRSGGIGNLIVASSDKAYGPSSELPYRETQPLVPASPYEASKAAAEMIARAYAHSYGLGLAVTRFANIFGGGDMNLSRLVPELILAVIQNRRPQIRSDGSPERDYLYIDDALSAYLAIEKLLETDFGGEQQGEGREIFRVFNAGGGEPYSVRELISILGTAVGRQLEADFLGIGVPDGEIDRQWVDSSELRAATGWRPATELEEGLRLTFAWYEAQADLFAAP